MKDDTGIPWEVGGERERPRLLGGDGLDVGLVLRVARI